MAFANDIKDSAPSHMILVVHKLKLLSHQMYFNILEENFHIIYQILLSNYGQIRGVIELICF